jgi:hypothetical protein
VPKAESRLTTVLYTGGWTRNPMPRPMPNRHCKVRSPNKISAINLIVSNGPHGKFMATCGDHYWSIYYTMINLKIKQKIIINPLN